MKDALGNDIITGNTYGYSRNNNGFTYIRIGKIVKINKSSVTMDVEVSKRSLYNGELKDEPLTNKISIKSIMLFPINYTEDQMRKAYITGIEHQEERCGYFNIEDYE